MPAASRIGDAIAPHGCWSGGTISGGAGTVIINGIPAARVGDPGTPHSWICPNPPGPHGVTISGGSGTVVIEGAAAARIGDPTACGSQITAGSGNVIIGG